MGSLDVNRKRSFRPGRAAVAASASSGATGFYLTPVVATAPAATAPLNMRAPAPRDPAAVALAEWVSEHFDTLEHDDIAQFLVFGHARFGRDA